MKVIKFLVQSITTSINKDLEDYTVVECDGEELLMKYKDIWLAWLWGIAKLEGKITDECFSKLIMPTCKRDLPKHLLKLGVFCKSIEIGIEESTNYIVCDFVDAQNLSNINLDGVNYLKKSTDKSLNLQEIPDTVFKVDKYLFSCSDVVKIDTKNVTGLDFGLFNRCESLKEVILRSHNINVIPDFCFNSCFSLESVVLNSVVSIHNCAFLNCKSLKKFDFDKVTYIGEKAFMGSGIRKVVLNKYRSTYLRAFTFANSDLETIIIRGSLKNIEDSCFANCTKLKYMELPESVTVVDNAIIDTSDYTLVCRAKAFFYQYQKYRGGTYEVVKGKLVKVW